jgi:hypothetical protein
VILVAIWMDGGGDDTRTIALDAGLKDREVSCQRDALLRGRFAGVRSERAPMLCGVAAHERRGSCWATRGREGGAGPPCRLRHVGRAAARAEAALDALSIGGTSMPVNYGQSIGASSMPATFGMTFPNGLGGSSQLHCSHNNEPHHIDIGHQLDEKRSPRSAESRPPTAGIPVTA